MTAWRKKNVTTFYIRNRSKFKDLYLSESKLLIKLKKKKINKILDFGCATGNFYKIFKSFFNKIDYIGIDSEKEMINNAIKIFGKNKNTKFILSNKKNFPFSKNYFDLTFCTSVLHHVKEYKKIVQELIRSSSKYIFIDSPRVHFGNDIVGLMNLDKRFDTKKRKKNNVNYYVLNIKKYLRFLKLVFKKHNISKVYFFCNKLPYSKDYMSFKKEIYYMTMLLIKSDKNHKFKKILYTKDQKIKKIFTTI
tara:strand:+ start:148 stop:894 length:747 start_codon:yes stop_codon:yes gene_type:complete